MVGDGRLGPPPAPLFPRCVRRAGVACFTGPRSPGRWDPSADCVVSRHLGLGRDSCTLVGLPSTNSSPSLLSRVCRGSLSSAAEHGDPRRESGRRLCPATSMGYRPGHLRGGPVWLTVPGPHGLSVQTHPSPHRTAVTRPRWLDLLVVGSAASGLLFPSTGPAAVGLGELEADLTHVPAHPRPG